MLRSNNELVIFMYVLVLLFYAPFYILFIRRWKSKTARKRLYRGITSVFENCADDLECVSQIQMLYKRESERYGFLSNNFRSAPEMMEDLIYSIDTLEQKLFEVTFGIEIPIKIRSRIINTLNHMKNMQPFSSLSSKEGNLLNMLKHAIDTQNSDLAKGTLSQLADEIEVLEGSLRTQYKTAKLSFVVSAVGIVLTLFFGIVSFIQFFAK